MIYGLDIETTGLVPWKDTITHISVVQHDGTPIHPSEFKSIPHGSEMVCWNAVFDIAHLHNAKIPVDRFKWLDAMLAYKWVKNSQRKEYSPAPYSLETAAKHLDVEWRDWFIEYKKQGIKSDWFHIGTIPNAVLMEWKKRYNVDLVNPTEDDLKMAEKLLMNPEWKYLRTCNRI